jgi:hypothetical protein
MQHGTGHAPWIWSCTTDMVMQHGYKHSLWTYVVMQHGQGDATWTWTYTMDMDMQHGHAHIMDMNTYFFETDSTIDKIK